jgi:hypothetical protein
LLRRLLRFERGEPLFDLAGAVDTHQGAGERRDSRRLRWRQLATVDFLDRLQQEHDHRLERLREQPLRLRPPWKDWSDALQAAGIDELRRALFATITSPRWIDAWWTHRRSPHAALGAAIDAADWPAFQCEIMVYEAGP